MKNLKLLTLLPLLGLCCASAQAAPGDTAGSIYTTDIRAYINGVEVPSYNIGGKTAVVIEDITDAYSYNNDARRLTLTNLDPDNLKGGASDVSGTVGTVVGSVYETDIKTCIYDVEIPSCNIGGRTAVAIEDLGNDGAFSEIGGRYAWDPGERTISLEFLYNTTPYWDTDTNITITFNNDLTEGTAEFSYPVRGSGELHFNWPEWAQDFSVQMDIQAIIPITAAIGEKKEIIGYHFIHPLSPFSAAGFTAFTYFYDDKYKQAISGGSVPALTREEIINDYLTTGGCSVIERFDTDDYSFLFMNGINFHGSTHHLLLVNADGSYHNYASDFESVSLHGQKFFTDVVIDKENEKVYLHYDFDYVIDLKTGDMQKR